jgi:hypothetical protein
MEGGDGDDEMDGGDGDDEMHGGPGDETDGSFPAMQGHAGDDEMHGGPGDDYIQGNEGKDAIFGDEGDDFLDGVGDESAGSQDTIVCGGGFDQVLANDNDVVAADCEVVIRFDDVAAGQQGRTQDEAQQRERERAQARRTGGR